MFSERKAMERAFVWTFSYNTFAWMCEVSSTHQ